MPRFSILLATAILATALGCSPTSDSGSAGKEQEREAISSDYGAVKADVRRLTPKSSEQDLRAGANRVQSVRKRLSTLTGRTAAEQTRITTLQSEEKRLEAALRVQQARREWEKLFSDAKLTRSQKKMSVEEKRAVLREMWPEFRRADDSLVTAERAYTDASNEVGLNLRREEGLGSK